MQNAMEPASTIIGDTPTEICAYRQTRARDDYDGGGEDATTV